MENKEVPLQVVIIPKGCPLEPNPQSSFTKLTLSVDPHRDTALTVRKKVGCGGFVTYFGSMPAEGEPLKSWFVLPDVPAVVLSLGEGFVESDSSASVNNDLQRLLNSGVPIQHAIIALSRAYWHTGFHEFSRAATACKKLVQEMIDLGTTYQRRVEFACMSVAMKELHHVGVFNEFNRHLQWPPALSGDVATYSGDWIESNRPTMSNEERQLSLKNATWIRETASPALEMASKSVVRCFGYHDNPKVTGSGSSLKTAASSASPTIVVPFTGFFVSPTLILCTRTCSYSSEHGTYANRYAFSRSVRAMHGMLRSEVDLFPCTEIRTVPNDLVQTIRNIGVEIPEDKRAAMPDSIATPYSDVMLLQVDPKYASEHYLLPPASQSLQSLNVTDRVFALGYHSCPDADWVDMCFGDQGYCAPDPRSYATTLLNQFWRYDVQTCSYGHVTRCDPDTGMFEHNASLLPSSRGSVLVTIDETTTPPIARFQGISCGRSLDAVMTSRGHIASNSIGDVGRREGYAANVFNTAMSSSHVSNVLCYQNYVTKDIPRGETTVNQFLKPYEILVHAQRLRECHQKMLKDADEYNEYGMRLWEGHQLADALYCFREGAKMFSIASIPEQSEYERNLKDALQSNVAAVIVARMGK